MAGSLLHEVILDPLLDSRGVHAWQNAGGEESIPWIEFKPKERIEN